MLHDGGQVSFKPQMMIIIYNPGLCISKMKPETSKDDNVRMKS